MNKMSEPGQARTEIEVRHQNRRYGTRVSPSRSIGAPSRSIRAF